MLSVDCMTTRGRLDDWLGQTAQLLMNTAQLLVPILLLNLHCTAKPGMLTIELLVICKALLWKSRLLWDVSTLSPSKLLTLRLQRNIAANCNN